ncbi:MAG: type I DNA topoisomerase [Alphaproteobacteria bacterium]
MDVVIVESPTKAKTINKYLGRDYTVIASYGHVRDLPPKDGSVRPDQDFEMSWQVEERAERPLGEIAKALRGAKRLILATDPDREGEAISWHVQEVLRQRKALGDIEVRRVVFNEITRDAVLDAMKHPRDLNKELIDAYLARRALDYLVGFSLSPVLWRKLPGSRSAGRVQSVALRLICEREAEIEAFKPREYWTVDADFLTTDGAKVTARLTHLGGKKLDKFALGNEAAARAAADAIMAGRFAVRDVEKNRVRRNPQPPFTTSTLQQEAARKLRFSASRTMRLAQQLYEGVDIGGEGVGLITYMRTDSVQLSREAITAARGMIKTQYGDSYLPEKPRVYKTRTKNAQEAHEAIRPTDLSRRPQDVAHVLDPDQQRLYELIWKRTVASEMASAEFDQIAADIDSADGAITLRATGSVQVFDGFLVLYQEGRDDPAEDEEGEGRSLPPLKAGDALARDAVRPEQHFTQPPPRYTEASLVKRLEELGIGRPSTYASILEILKARKYVLLDKGRFVPEDRGRIVTAFLANFFERYVQYNFTAEMEERLDDISGGRIDWKTVLREFWQAFGPAVDGTKDLSVSQVITTLDEYLGVHFFPETGTGVDVRLCPGCNTGRLGLKLGKFGAFIGCSRYPECRFTRALAVQVPGADGKNGAELIGPRELGPHPVTGKPVSVRKGPYGHYVQLEQENGEEKPRRVSIPKPLDPTTIELEMAVKLLSLPREVGLHPESGKPVTAGLGRFGPYVQHDGAYRSVDSVEDVLSIGLNRAVDLLAAPARRGANTLRSLGAHPEDGKPVAIMSGRYGPYIKHLKTNAPLPRDKAPEEVTLEEAVQLLAARAARPSKGRRRPGGARAGKAPPAAAKGKRKARPPAEAASN